MGSRILIVEDEAKLREVLCDYFSSKGDLPVAASNGVEALERMGEESVDAVLLDMMMPELDGFSVCRALRRTSDVPILFFTALSDEEDKLMGYALGADDYITKPFSLSVLYAKTMALIKRSRGTVRTITRGRPGRWTPTSSACGRSWGSTPGPSGPSSRRATDGRGRDGLEKKSPDAPGHDGHYLAAGGGHIGHMGHFHGLPHGGDRPGDL